MSECFALKKKNNRPTANAILVSSLSQILDMQTEFKADFPKEYLPFLSHGFVSFV